MREFESHRGYHPARSSIFHANQGQPVTQQAATHRFTANGEDLADVLFDAVNSAKAGKPLERVSVVTPSHYSNFYLRRWLASRGLLNVEFLRIEELADLLARNEIDNPDRRQLKRLEGTELVGEAVAECVRSGEITGQLADVAQQPTFLAALHRSLQELEAEDLLGQVSLDQLSESEDVARAIGTVWRTYKRLKSENNLFDRTQVAAWAVEALKAGTLEDQEMHLAVGKLVVLAVAAPAPQYRSLWKSLINLRGSTTVVVTTGDERSDSFVAAELDLPFALPVPGDLEFPVPRIVAASDVRSEIAAVVSDVAMSAADGIPLNRIAVVFGNTSYSSRVRSALKLAGIPVAGPPQDSLGASVTGRFVTRLLRFATQDMARQDVGDWLATCPVKNPVTQLPVNGVEWDGISKAARVTTGIASWKREVARFAVSRRRRAELIERQGDDDGEDGPISQSSALRKQAESSGDLHKFVSELSEALRTPNETMSWNSWCEWLARLIDSYLHTSEGDGSVESRERVEIVLEQISGLDSLRGASPDIERFSAVVSRELSENRSGANRLGKGVFVAPVRDIVGTRFERVHVVGMVDGTFPSPDSADPLLSDSVREELNRSFNIRLSRSGVRLDERRRQFFTALMAGSSTTLYWPRSASAGRSNAGPAQWLVEQARRFPGAERVHAGDLLTSPEQIPGVKVADYGSGETFSDSHEYTVASIRRHLDSKASATKHWVEFERSVRMALSLEQGRYGASLTEWSGDVSDATSSVPAVNEEVLSASRVESFAACPLRYFFSYVLKVSPGVREDDSFHMAPDRRGTFIHSVLETYLNMRIRGNKPVGAKTLDDALEEVKGELQRGQPDLGGPVWDVDIAQARRRLRRWLAAEADLEAEGFTPIAAELAFGRSHSQMKEEPLPPLEITLSDSTVLKFSGVIDRVDQHTNGMRYVLDYKTGNARRYRQIADDPVDRGRHLQLALYTEAVSQSSEVKSDTAAAYWFVMDSQASLIPEIDLFDPTLVSRRLREVLEVLVGTSRDGYFPPNPGDRGYGPKNDSFESCGYCDFNRVCPTASRRERMVRQHAKDPRLVRYFDLSLDRGDESSLSPGDSGS